MNLLCNDGPFTFLHICLMKSFSGPAHITKAFCVELTLARYKTYLASLSLVLFSFIIIFTITISSLLSFSLHSLTFLLYLHPHQLISTGHIISLPYPLILSLFGAFPHSSLTQMSLR
jgi:hypothetical protein